MDNPNKLEKLKSILELMQNDTITPAKLAQFITAVVKIVKDSKDNMESVSTEMKETLKQALSYLDTEHSKLVDSIAKSNDTKISAIEKKTLETLAKAEKALEEIRAIEVHDGEDADEDEITEKVLARIVIPEPKEVELDEAEDIVEKLESLEGEDRLDAKAIKNLPKIVKGMVVTSQHYLPGTGITIEGNVISSTATGGVDNFLDLTDTPDAYTGQGGKVVAVKADVSGLEFIAATDTDEKIKYDAADPTAGYVADKIIAGTGISVAEGTGADENKLVITNSDKGSDVDLSGYALTGDIPSDISELTDTTNIIPTDTGDLTNGAGFITAGDIPAIPDSVDDLSPSQTGNSGKFLKTDGTNATWESIPGGSGITRTQVTTTGNLTLGTTADVDYVYYVAGAHTLSMPSPNDNRYSIKNNHSANITIDTAGAELIEGAASISIAPQSAVDIISDGTNWYVF